MLTETATKSFVNLSSSNSHTTPTTTADQSESVNDDTNDNNDPDVIFEDDEHVVTVADENVNTNNNENSNNVNKDVNKDDEIEIEMISSKDESTNQFQQPSSTYSSSTINITNSSSSTNSTSTNVPSSTTNNMSTANSIKNSINEVNEVTSLSTTIFESSNVPTKSTANNETVLLSSDSEEDDNNYDIIDGIMVLSFATKDELNKFTNEDEKFRNKSNNQTTKRTVTRKSTTTTRSSRAETPISLPTPVEKKVPVQRQYICLNQDSIFGSSELDEDLARLSSKPTKSNLDENLYLFDNRSIFNSYDSDSSFNSSTTTRKSTSTAKANTSNNKSKSKSSRKSLQPDIILTNKITETLPETNEYDRAYLKCLEQAANAYNSITKDAKNRFKPKYLHQQFICREALKAIHPNFLLNNSKPTNVAKSSTPNTSSLKALLTSNENELKTSNLNTNRMSTTVNSTNLNKKNKDQQQSSNSTTIRLKSQPSATITTSTIVSEQPPIPVRPIIKPEPEEEKYLEEMVKVKTDPIEVDKIVRGKKGRNDFHEDGFDLALLISKHSKRDIKLPARYHESIVGTQWILPDFEENKNRIVNTGTGKKQSNKCNNNNKKSTSKTAVKSDDNLIGSGIGSMSNLSEQTVDNSNASNYNLDDLMTEDEDNGIMNNTNASTSSLGQPTNNSNATKISTTLVNNKTTSMSNSKKLTLEKEQKLLMLKELYRKLFFANRPVLMDYYAKKLIKPRVNKLEVLEEGCQTIAALEKQQKSYASANNVLISWNNKLKLCLRDIEQSEGNLNIDKIKEYENLVNSYRTKGLGKFNQFIKTVEEYNSKINSTVLPSNELATMSTSIGQQPTPQQQHQQQIFTNQMTNGFKKLDATNITHALNNKTIINSTSKQPSATFNCHQPNVAFLDNTNGIQRVMNLKPKKTITINPANRSNSTIVNNFHFKSKNNSTIANNNNNNPVVSGIPRSRANKINNTKLIKSNHANQFMSNGNSLLSKNQISNNNNPHLNKNFVHTNVNFVSSTPSNSFLTFKITDNQIQMPYCASADIVPVPIANTPNQINHHLPQIVPNHNLAPSNHPPFVTLNFLKQNNITSHHPNLSITESLSAPTSSNPTSSSQTAHVSNIRSFPKILPKFPTNNLPNNMVKMTTPVLFSPNLQLLPTKQNIVISPINPISTSAPCQIRTTFYPTPKATTSVIATHPKTMTSNSKIKPNETPTLKVFDPTTTSKNMTILPKFVDQTRKKEVGV